MNAPAPETPITVSLSGDLPAVEFITRLQRAGLALRTGDTGYPVIVLSERELDPFADAPLTGPGSRLESQLAEIRAAGREHIEQQRRKLQRASAVLLALVYSLDHGLESEQAGDVASTALDLVEQAVAALDSVAIGGATSKRIAGDTEAGALAVPK